MAQCCPECDGRVRRERTEMICEGCGLVTDEDPIDRGPEWRSFIDDDTNPVRTGAPLTRSRHDRGLSTEIGYSTRLKGRKRRRIARMRRQHNRARIATKAERNQVYAFTEIRRITSSLQLPESIRDRACVLFESAQNADLLRGRSLEGFAAAAVYATCRTESVSRTLDEIIAVARSSGAELKAAYDALNRELGLPTVRSITRVPCAVCLRASPPRWHRATRQRTGRGSLRPWTGRRTKPEWCRRGVSVHRCEREVS